MSDGGISLETIQQESSVKYYIYLCWYYLLIVEFFFINVDERFISGLE